MAYTPTTWNDGDVITAEKMNKLEQGVKDNVGPKGEKGDPGAAGAKGEKVIRDLLVLRDRVIHSLRRIKRRLVV